MFISTERRVVSFGEGQTRRGQRDGEKSADALALAAVVVHVADLPEDAALRPALFSCIGV